MSRSNDLVECVRVSIFIGDLVQCSEAADRLTKKQVNAEIESDYERGPDENQSTQITGKSYSVFGSSTSRLYPSLPWFSDNPDIYHLDRCSVW